MTKPLVFEPREASPLDFYSAQADDHAEHEARWPGPIEEITAAEPNCTTYRKYAAQASKAATPAAHVESRRAPRIPRGSDEPCKLHIFLVLLGLIGLGLVVLAGSVLHGCVWLIRVISGYADAFLPAVVRWIGGVL